MRNGTAVFAALLATCILTSRGDAEEPKPNVVTVTDPDGRGTIACQLHVNDLRGDGALTCNASDMEIRVNGRRISSWLIPIRVTGEPCCNAYAPCCGPQVPGCPCDIQILMEKKQAYPAECTKWERGWHCDLGPNGPLASSATDGDRCSRPAGSN